MSSKRYGIGDIVGKKSEEIVVMKIMRNIIYVKEICICMYM